jgi:ABC-type dipeptide/oligopeptide/nickel transport system ATPase subunit
LETILSLKNLDKKYGRVHAVNNLSFDIQKGNVYGILGPNGSGKSTTLGKPIQERKKLILCENMQKNFFNIISLAILKWIGMEIIQIIKNGLEICLCYER